MKLFLTKTIIFLIVATILFILFIVGANGHSDPFYLRFTGLKKENLILGTSKAAQGLQPRVFKELLNEEFFNFSFTVNTSSYGPTYEEKIFKKLKMSNDGIFILTVDPWSISANSLYPNEKQKFSELSTFFSKVHAVNGPVNIEYLLKAFEGKYYRIILSYYYELFNKKGTGYLHDDGWFEISVSMDSTAVANRLYKQKMNYLNDYIHSRSFSEVRFNHLVRLIKELKTIGSVFLIRLPVHKEIYDIENLYMPNFDSLMYISGIDDSYYLDMNNNLEFDYTDGVHLYKGSGEDVSKMIAKWIKTKLNK